MTNMFLSPNVATAISKANSYASSGLIDSLSNLRNQRVYIFSGSSDYVVRSSTLFFVLLPKNHQIIYSKML